MKKFRSEIIYGLLMFALVVVYFTLLRTMDLHQNIWLRLVNVLFVLFAINLSIRTQVEAGSKRYLSNFSSGVVTMLVGTVLSTIAIIVYLKVTGAGELTTIQDTETEAGEAFNAFQFGMQLFIEGVIAGFILVFMSMQFWKSKDKEH